MIGLIVKGIAGFYYVKVNVEIIECKARGKFRFDELTPMVGDRVEITVVKNKGVIEKVLQRTSELIRPTVANVTQAFVIFSLKNPDINMELLYKFLVLCEYNSLKAVVCLNKIDLKVDKEYKEIVDAITGMGYEIIYMNAKEGLGLSDLYERLKNNITVLCGPSGAGKSTLFNKLCGDNIMKTGEVSDKIGRGKHTTRHSELIELNDGFIVDTPGFSSLDIGFIDKSKLQHCFPEFDEYKDCCRFTGCMHYKEPGCAVKAAESEGKINSRRYEFYIKIVEELLNGRNKKW